MCTGVKSPATLPSASEAGRQRHFGERPDHRRPFAHAPFRHEPVHDVGIGLGERFGRRGGVALEQQHGSIDRVGKSAGEDEIAATGSLARQLEMRRAEWRAALHEPVHDVVEQQIVHGAQRPYDAKTLVCPCLSNVRTLYGWTRFPCSMPGEPIGMPGTATPTTAGRSLINRWTSDAGTCPSIT